MDLYRFCDGCGSQFRDNNNGNNNGDSDVNRVNVGVMRQAAALSTPLRNLSSNLELEPLPPPKPPTLQYTMQTGYCYNCYKPEICCYLLLVASCWILLLLLLWLLLVGIVAGLIRVCC